MSDECRLFDWFDPATLWSGEGLPSISQWRKVLGRALSVPVLMRDVRQLYAETPLEPASEAPAQAQAQAASEPEPEPEPEPVALLRSVQTHAVFATSHDYFVFRGIDVWTNEASRTPAQKQIIDWPHWDRLEQHRRSHLHWSDWITITLNASSGSFGLEVQLHAGALISKHIQDAIRGSVFWALYPLSFVVRANTAPATGTETKTKPASSALPPSLAECLADTRQRSITHAQARAQTQLHDAMVRVASQCGSASGKAIYPWKHTCPPHILFRAAAALHTSPRATVDVRARAAVLMHLLASWTWPLDLLCDIAPIRQNANAFMGPADVAEQILELVECTQHHLAGPIAQAQLEAKEVVGSVARALLEAPDLEDVKSKTGLIIASIEDRERLSILSRRLPDPLSVLMITGKGARALPTHGEWMGWLQQALSHPVHTPVQKQESKSKPAPEQTQTRPLLWSDLVELTPPTPTPFPIPNQILQPSCAYRLADKTAALLHQKLMDQPGWRLFPIAFQSHPLHHAPYPRSLWLRDVIDHFFSFQAGAADAGRDREIKEGVRALLLSWRENAHPSQTQTQLQLHNPENAGEVYPESGKDVLLRTLRIGISDVTFEVTSRPDAPARAFLESFRAFKKCPSTPEPKPAPAAAPAPAPAPTRARKPIISLAGMRKKTTGPTRKYWWMWLDLLLRTHLFDILGGYQHL